MCHTLQKSATPQGSREATRWFVKGWDTAQCFREARAGCACTGLYRGMKHWAAAFFAAQRSAQLGHCVTRNARLPGDYRRRGPSSTSS